MNVDFNFFFSKPQSRAWCGLAAHRWPRGCTARLPEFDWGGVPWGERAPGLHGSPASMIHMMTHDEVLTLVRNLFLHFTNILADHMEILSADL